MEKPSDCVCLNLRMAARAASRAYDEALAPTGLKNTQFSLLALIHQHQPVAVSELAETAVMDRTTLTRNLRPLEREKLVSIEHGEDRRVRMVSLTRHGKDRLKAGLPHWRKAQKQMFENLGPARRKRLLQDLAFAAKIGS